MKFDNDCIITFWTIPVFFCELSDSCKRVRCLYGISCLQDQNGLPHCVTCVTKCPDVEKPNYVCGDNQVTYQSICHVRAATCLKQRSISIAYSGVCRGRLQMYNFILTSKFIINTFNDTSSHRERIESIVERKRPFPIFQFRN